MASSSRGGYESLTLGYMLIAFAISILLAWLAADWWLVIPIFLLEAGAYYCVTASAIRAGKDSSYRLFWGGTLALVGILWLVNRQYPDNAVLLFVLFVLWLGGFAMALAVGRMRGGQAHKGQ